MYWNVKPVDHLAIAGKLAIHETIETIWVTRYRLLYSRLVAVVVVFIRVVSLPSDPIAQAVISCCQSPVSDPVPF